MKLNFDSQHYTDFLSKIDSLDSIESHIYLANYNLEEPIFLHFKHIKMQSKLIFINIYFPISLNYFTDNDTKLLLEEEYSIFQQFIHKQLEYESEIYNFCLNSKNNFFIKKRSQNIQKNDLTCTHIDNFIEQKKIEFLNLFNDIKRFDKNKIDHLFECALLRNQIINF